MTDHDLQSEIDAIYAWTQEDDIYELQNLFESFYEKRSQMEDKKTIYLNLDKLSCGDFSLDDEEKIIFSVENFTNPEITEGVVTVDSKNNYLMFNESSGEFYVTQAVAHAV